MSSPRVIQAVGRCHHFGLGENYLSLHTFQRTLSSPLGTISSSTNVAARSRKFLLRVESARHNLDHVCCTSSGEIFFPLRSLEICDHFVVQGTPGQLEIPDILPRCVTSTLPGGSWSSSFG